MAKEPSCYPTSRTRGLLVLTRRTACSPSAPLTPSTKRPSQEKSHWTLALDRYYGQEMESRTRTQWPHQGQVLFQRRRRTDKQRLGRFLFPGRCSFSVGAVIARHRVFRYVPVHSSLILQQEDIVPRYSDICCTYCKDPTT